MGVGSKGLFLFCGINRLFKSITKLFFISFFFFCKTRLQKSRIFGNPKGCWQAFLVVSRVLGSYHAPQAVNLESDWECWIGLIQNFIAI